MNPSCDNKQGLALVTTLIIVLVLSILVIQGFRTAILEEKMSQAYHQRALLFQSAEAALLAIESAIMASRPISLSATNVCNPNAVDLGGVRVYPEVPATCVELWKNNDVAWHNAIETRVDSLAITPTYLLESLSGNRPCPFGGNDDVAQNCRYFRATVRASAPGLGEVILQGIIAVQ